MSETLKFKKDIFLNFYFFIMYLYTSMPALQFNMTANSNIFFLIFGYAVTGIAAVRYKVDFFNKKLILVLLIVVVWTCLQFVINKTFFRLSPFIILEIFSAYIIINVFKYSILRRFENVTYILCIIAIIGWIFTLAFQSLMVSLVEVFGIEADGENSSSIIIYTVHLNESIRNCGFSWEPGRMACMICVGILFYLMRTKYKLKTKRFCIMVVCLITTLSTTGFCTILVILTLCYISSKRVSPIALTILILLSASIFSLPFMYDKIEELAEHATEEGISSIGRSLDWEADNEGFDRDYYVPQRFQGLMLSVINLQNTNIFIGDGRDFTQFYINRINNWNVKTSEGILEPIVQFGAILSLGMYCLLFFISKNISKIYNVKNKWLYFITFVMISISYNFWESPIFMALWMLPLYYKSK